MKSKDIIFSANKENLSGNTLKLPSKFVTKFISDVTISQPLASRLPGNFEGNFTERNYVSYLSELKSFCPSLSVNSISLSHFPGKLKELTFIDCTLHIAYFRSVLPTLVEHMSKIIDSVSYYSKVGAISSFLSALCLVL